MQATDSYSVTSSLSFLIIIIIIINFYFIGVLNWDLSTFFTNMLLCVVSVSIDSGIRI